MVYSAEENRYDNMKYTYCGKSGLKLPRISLGMWHNFGDQKPFENSREMILGAFDLGITYFDLANNYGPSAGSAEETFGQVFKKDLIPYRDEIIVSTKAGFDMWKGPYGSGGSKKYLVSSLNQSLKRMNLDYVDIFYHHVRDEHTPLEETMDALSQIVHEGKALYVGISNYNAEDSVAAYEILKSMGVHCLINQMSYNMLDRHNEPVLIASEKQGIGTIAYSPLAQGRLTNRYFNGIPEDSRAAGESVFLTKDNISEDLIKEVKDLNELADSRDQSLAQMALSFILYQNFTSVIIGASKLSQIKGNIGALKNINFSKEELDKINLIIK